jgi:hypothetical protein
VWKFCTSPFIRNFCYSLTMNFIFYYSIALQEDLKKNSRQLFLSIVFTRFFICTTHAIFQLLISYVFASNYRLIGGFISNSHFNSGSGYGSRGPIEKKKIRIQSVYGSESTTKEIMRNQSFPPSGSSSLPTFIPLLSCL